jgi:hypothetical protein
MLSGQTYGHVSPDFLEPVGRYLPRLVTLCQMVALLDNMCVSEADSADFPDIYCLLAVGDEVSHTWVLSVSRKPTSPHRWGKSAQDCKSMVKSNA